MKLLAVVTALVVLASGCSARQVAPAAPPDTREGLTSVRILTRDSAPAPEGVEIERITPAFASEDNALPGYPGYALRAGCGSGTVPIRLHVGTDGNVARMLAIPDRPVVDDQCHSAFWAATCAAVAGWKFAPAFRQTPAPGPDLDGDGRPDFTGWEHEAVTIFLDFEFSFRVIDGRGEVRQGPGAAHGSRVTPGTGRESGAGLADARNARGPGRGTGGDHVLD